MSHKRKPAPRGQRPAGYVPPATLPEAEARAIPQQPEALRRWWEQKRLPPEPEGHVDHIVDGKSGQVTSVKQGEAPPKPPTRRGHRKAWCSVCNRYLTQREVKAGHTHGATQAAAKPRSKKPRQQNWRWQGLAGRQGP
jgi:hypothetical protein